MSSTAADGTLALRAVAGQRGGVNAVPLVSTRSSHPAARCPTGHVQDVLRQLARLNSQRWDVWSAAEAMRFGFTPTGLAGLVRDGVVWRPARGWYAVREPDADARRLHGQRVHALIGRHHGAVVASHHSALILHGVPVHAADLSVVHLTYTGRGSHRIGPGYVVHAADCSVTELGDRAPGSPTVPPEHAVIQTGLLWGPVEAVIAGDHLLRQGQLDGQELERVLAGYRGRAGVVPVARALGWAHAGAESAGESVLRCAMRLLGYRVTPQYVVPGLPYPFRLDLVVDGTRVAVEFDGRAKYQNPDEAPRQAWRQELIERHGWVFVRVRWHELFLPGSTELDLVTLRHRIENALGRAALLAAGTP